MHSSRSRPISPPPVQYPSSVSLADISIMDDDPIANMGASGLDLKKAPGEATIKARSIFSKCCIKELIGHKKKVYSVAWNCTGDKLASGSTDYNVGIWSVDMIQTKNEQMLKGHTDAVDQLVWSPTNPASLVTVSSDKTVRIWDTRVHKYTRRIGTEGQNINVTWSPDANYIGVGNKKDVISVLDCRTWKVTAQHKYNREVNEMLWHPNMKYFLFATVYGSIEVMSFPEFKQVHQLKSHGGSCFTIQISPDSRYLATGGADALMCLWDLKDLVCLRSFHHTGGTIRTLGFSHDGAFLASGSEDGPICIYEVSSGLLVHKIDSSLAVNSIAFNPKHNLLAYAVEESRRSLSVFGFPRHR